MPPCPGMISAKSLTLIALLNPEAKNPPKGATKLAKREKTSEWIWKSETPPMFCGLGRKTLGISQVTFWKGIMVKVSCGQTIYSNLLKMMLN
jgi:hypothetical protein